MKASFDGVRIQLAAKYNEMAATELSDEQCQIMIDMQPLMIALMCMQDPRDQPHDCNSLAEKITIYEPKRKKR